MTPIHATYKSGGGHRCMTSVNPDIYIEGGYSLDNVNYERTGKLYKVEVEYDSGKIFLAEKVDNQFRRVEELTMHALDFIHPSILGSHRA